MQIFNLRFYSAAGFLPDFQRNVLPGKLDARDKTCLRELAGRAVELSKRPEQAEKRELWFRHNSLGKTRPMLLAFPEDSWFEILGESELVIADPFWRQTEWYFRHLLYRAENIDDDFVTENEFLVQGIFKSSGWGLYPEYRKTADKGSFVWDAPVKEERNLDQLKPLSVEPDIDMTDMLLKTFDDLFGDIIPVRVNWNIAPYMDIMGTLVMLRGMENVLIDIYDRPEWLHKLIGFITDSMHDAIKSIEKEGCLSLNNQNHYTDTGGLGYTKELPKHGNIKNKPMLRDLWGFAAAQEFSLVSPHHHEEFAINYQKKILSEFGLCAYGCCEPLTHKFDIVKSIPNLRRISVSPWCDIRTASESLEDRYIYSWKPNPVMLLGKYDKDEIRKFLRTMLDITKDNVTEIILKDTITLQGEPQRLISFIDIAREEIEKG